MRANNISDASRLQVGMRLRIPSGTSAQPQYTEYQVVRNDTLYSIAGRYGITLQELLTLNGFSSSHVIKPGDRVKVPVLTRTVQGGVPQGVPPLLSNETGSGVDSSVRWPVKAKSVSYMTGKLFCVLVEGERSESVRSLTHGIVRSAQPFQGYGRMAIVEVPGGYFYV
jgi:LysM repeat protein